MSILLLTNGTIVTAAEAFAADILIDGERIRQIGCDLDVAADTTMSLAGKYILPGGIDAHTHLDMPLGDIRSCDDFESGTIAAACGGTTTIVDYAAHARG